jgi:1-acyl-sn-glycerol-3-phosphate acyltransferase
VRVDRVRRDRLEQAGLAVPDPNGQAFVSVGRPLPGHEVKIVDEAGSPAGERVQGRIRFRGPSMMQGYFRRPEATAAITFDGWLDTGDLGYWAGGELYITGRSKDVILKAGRNLHPHDIESAASEVEGVRKGCVAAFGAADPRQGTERLVVAAETRETSREARERLRAAVEERVLEAVGIPADDIVFLAPGALPKTSSGKLRRAECRRLYEEGKLAAGRPSRARQWLHLALLWAPHALRRAGRAAGRAAYGVWCWWAFGLLFAAARLAPGRQQRLARVFVRLTGLGPEVEGLEHLPAGPAVIAANHASYLDPVLFLAAVPRRLTFVAKREVLETPVLRAIIRGGGHLVVERRETGASAAGVDQVAGALQAGRTVLVFAEGTFTRARGLRPFRLGAFQAAARAGCPVAPAALSGSRHVLPDGSWLPRPGPVRIVFGRPLHPTSEDWREVLRLRDGAFAHILAHCGEPRLEVASAEIPA